LINFICLILFYYVRGRDSPSIPSGDSDVENNDMDMDDSIEVAKPLSGTDFSSGSRQQDEGEKTLSLKWKSFILCFDILGYYIPVDASFEKHLYEMLKDFIPSQSGSLKVFPSLVIIHLLKLMIGIDALLALQLLHHFVSMDDSDFKSISSGLEVLKMFPSAEKVSKNKDAVIKCMAIFQNIVLLLKNNKRTPLGDECEAMIDCAASLFDMEVDNLDDAYLPDFIIEWFSHEDPAVRCKIAYCVKFFMLKWDGHKAICDDIMDKMMTVREDSPDNFSTELKPGNIYNYAYILREF
jgi:hypothetical protein